MLPVVDKPVIQYIVEEAVEAGIEEIVFVTALGKRAIEDHFDRNFELEYRLEQKGKLKELEKIKEIGKLANFAFVRQDKPMGDGHAILSALPFVGEDEPVAVLFGDDIVSGGRSAIGELIETWERTGESVVSMQEVPMNEVYKYGVIGGEMMSDNEMRVEEFVEKPSVEEAPSNLIVIGRYVITPQILKILKHQEAGKDGEIRLADAFGTHLKNGGELYGRKLSGRRYDCGNKLQFIIAQIELGLEHGEVGEQLKKYLENRV